MNRDPLEPLARVAVPRLSDDFEARLRRRLLEEPAVPGLADGAMRAYWALAGVVAVYLLCHLPRPQALVLPLVLALLALVVMVPLRLMKQS